MKLKWISVKYGLKDLFKALITTELIFSISSTKDLEPFLNFPLFSIRILSNPFPKPKEWTLNKFEFFSIRSIHISLFETFPSVNLLYFTYFNKKLIY